MPQSFTAVRDLTATEAALDGAIEHAKQSAFKEALDQAIDAYGSADLPQDHAVYDFDEPTKDGGHHLRVTLTLP